MTQLCAIPTCRIRGRHLPACQDDACGGCLPRVADEGLICDADMARAERQLTEIIDFTPDARAVAYGEVRRSTGGGSNKPGSRSPGNDDAMDAITDTHDRLARACITIAVRRGMRFHVPCLNDCVKPTPSQAHCSVCHITFGGITGFDRHRRDGQCLTPEAIGYTRSPTGVYRAPMSEAGKARLDALSAPQADENGPLVGQDTPEPQEAP